MTQAHPPGVQVAALPVGPAGPRCACVKRHRPLPAEDEGHHPVPTGQPFNGPPNQELIWLCPNAHSSVHALLRAYLKARRTGQPPDRDAIAHYSPYVRRLVRVALDALGTQEAPP